MGVASYKHDIKTLFLVLNSCISLTIGLFPVSVGVAVLLSEYYQPELVIGTIAVGTFMLCLASLGHYAAIVGKGTALRVYAAVTGLVTMAEVMVVSKFTGPWGADAPPVLIFGIFHTALTLSATTLAMVLAKQTRRTYPVLPSLGANPSAPTAL